MAPVPKRGVVAVTGAAGFIGGWVVRTLLDQGYRVRACVRDADDAARTTFLKQMPGYASGRLTVHSANLDQAGCFDEIFKGCHGVAHVSHLSNYKDLDYAGKVCAHIIDSVNNSETVGRVIVTSSVAAVMNEMDVTEFVRRPVLYEERYPNELDPRRTPDRQGYSIAKLVAQRVFADAAEKHGRWDAITCCPGDNVGPIQSAHQKDMGPWQHLIELMLLGECEARTGPWRTVDVRDDALCHVRLLESVWVKNGERYIAWNEPRYIEDILASIDRLLPELGFDAAPVKHNLPPETTARLPELRRIWAGAEIRNDRMRAVAGIEFRPLDDSIRDCVESLISVAKVRPRLKPGFALREPELQPA